MAGLLCSLWLALCAQDSAHRSRPAQDAANDSTRNARTSRLPPPLLGDTLPGAPAPGADLVARLEAAWRGLPAGYRPRTRHLLPDGAPEFTNRLLLEPSPYLRQHAHNPVNWYPWGEEAFETARRLHRPVLLSVGYSTCHWCHVMEEESFEDLEVARMLNEHYVAIKVDREERPDVDATYMSAVQLMTGGGGWPMTVWLTGDRKPFYGATYIPARDGDRGTRTGFLTLLGRLSQAYAQEPEKVEQSSARLVAAVRQALVGPAAVDSLPGVGTLSAALAACQQNFDPTNGGPNRAPKFPSSLPLRFLFQEYHRTGNSEAMAMARLTLTRMAGGGMYDQVGGGFHRYSTDASWLVPHFEKTLYDNALLTVTYLDGWQATRDENDQRIAREILRYVARDMTAPGGGFYSATDADSPSPDGHREEGRFFTWTPAELEAALGREDARLVERYYGMTAAGNFEGRSILHLPHSHEEAARALGMSPAKLRGRVDDAREVLVATRSHRAPPARDEKILAAWNGLMISAYAHASLVLGEPAYAQTASRAADFVLNHMRRSGELLRSYKDGQARGTAFLEDYAFMIAGLLDLYEATGEIRWMGEALALEGVLARLYEDPEHGGFYLTPSSHEAPLARAKPAYDGAEPSGNSVQALNLLRLAEFTNQDSYRVRADHTLRAFGAPLASSPLALSEMLLALEFRLDSPLELVLISPKTRSQAGPLLEKLREVYLPNRVLVQAVEGEDLKTQSVRVPLLEDRSAIGGRATAYVCRGGTCKLPTTDPGVFQGQLIREP